MPRTPIITHRTYEYLRREHRPGRYWVRLVCKVNGRQRQKTVPCNNPAYGVMVLDQWELDVIDRPKASCRQNAVS